MSRKTRPERPAMHQAWTEVRERVEGQIRRYKHMLTHHQKSLKQLREIQANLEDLKQMAWLLYEVRERSKKISFARWQKRHEIYPHPEMLPPCQKPSRHPEHCACPKKEVNA